MFYIMLVVTLLLSNALNGVSVNSDGTFRVVVGEGDITLDVRANGYLNKTVVINSSEFTDGIASCEITLSKATATISGTCNVEGAKITLESDPTIFTYVTNGKYELQVPTTGNAKLLITANGYLNQTVSVGKNALVQSATSNQPCIKNVTMVQE